VVEHLMPLHIHMPLNNGVTVIKMHVVKFLKTDKISQQVKLM
jgi:hypothetical protein